jgi:hypothetical protein
MEEDLGYKVAVTDEIKVFFEENGVNPDYLDMPFEEIPGSVRRAIREIRMDVDDPLDDEDADLGAELKSLIWKALDEARGEGFLPAYIVLGTVTYTTDEHTPEE